MNADTRHLRDWLLEADMAELRHPPADVAQHLNECVTCRSALRTVMQSYQQLDTGLNTLVRPRRRPWIWLPLPLAAAAVSALLLTQSEPAPRGPSAILTQLMFPEEPIVTPPAGKDAIVMEKNELTIVWLTNSRGQ
jgi:hypothetical protein